MGVIVTADAPHRKSQERFRKVFHLDAGAFCSRNVLRHMAFSAYESGMFALQRVAGLPVVKLQWIPFDEREVPPVVVGMTSGAILARRVPVHERHMSTAPRRNPCRNFGMAFEAPEDRCATSKLVAGTASGRAVQFPVGL